MDIKLLFHLSHKYIAISQCIHSIKFNCELAVSRKWKTFFVRVPHIDIIYIQCIHNVCLLLITTKIHWNNVCIIQFSRFSLRINVIKLTLLYVLTIIWYVVVTFNPIIFLWLRVCGRNLYARNSTTITNLNINQVFSMNYLLETTTTVMT